LPFLSEQRFLFPGISSYVVMTTMALLPLPVTVTVSLSDCRIDNWI